MTPGEWKISEIELKALAGIIAVMWTMLNILFWARIKRIENDIEKNRKEEKEIKENYLKRFEKVHERLNQMEINIIRHIENEQSKRK